MNEKISQKQAVLDAVKGILGDLFIEGETVVKGTLTSDQLTTIRDLVADGIYNKQVAFSKDNATIKEIRSYVNGMVDNHLRKAKELNGGQKYMPATRATSENVQQKATKVATVKAVLQARSVPKGAEHIDFDSLPNELQESLLRL